MTAAPNRGLAEPLGYAGLLPFLLGPLGAFGAGSVVHEAIAPGLVMWCLFYGAIILSFMAGGRWGLAVEKGEGGRLIPAVTPALIGWAALVPDTLLFGGSISIQARLIVLIIAFAGLFAAEVRSGELPSWYQTLRLRLTTGVSILLGLTVLGVG